MWLYGPLGVTARRPCSCRSAAEVQETPCRIRYVPRNLIRTPLHCPRLRVCYTLLLPLLHSALCSFACFTGHSFQHQRAPIIMWSIGRSAPKFGSFADRRPQTACMPPTLRIRQKVQIYDRAHAPPLSYSDPFGASLQSFVSGPKDSTVIMGPWRTDAEAETLG